MSDARSTTPWYRTRFTKRMIAEEFAALSIDAMSFESAPITASSSPRPSPRDLIMSATESLASP